MLKSLRVDNYAIIHEIDLTFDKGLNIITGETGAGKSILLGALSLVMGKRADSLVLNDKTRKCIIEAVFVDYPSTLDDFLDRNDLDKDVELILRREISHTGKSRAFVNDTPVNLSVMQAINEELIDLNQQFQILEIQTSDFQVRMLDALAGTSALYNTYKSLFNTFRNAQKRLAGLKEDAARNLKEKDFVAFQLEELLEADIQPDEKETKEAHLKKLENSSEIINTMEETEHVLDQSEQSIKDVIRQLRNRWEALADMDPLVRDGVSTFIEMEELISDLQQKIRRIINTAEMDPRAEEELRERLDQIYKLEQKHQARDTAGLIEIMGKLESQLEGYTSLTDSIAQLEQKTQRLLDELHVLAKELSQKRMKIRSQVEKDIHGSLQSLAMPAASIHIDIKPAAELNVFGLENIEILFSPNKGSMPLPIRKIASGGEKSRLMLALKASVAGAVEMPTMIFDEIDTGVSGEVAQRMGDILKSLAQPHQILAITHSPQVSARADKHFKVYKEESKGKTLTYVKNLNGEERITEIAMMLSGDPPSAYAIENARELITEAR